MARIRVKKQIMNNRWANGSDHLMFIGTKQSRVKIFREQRRGSGAYIVRSSDNGCLPEINERELNQLAVPRSGMQDNVLKGEIFPYMNDLYNTSYWNDFGTTVTLINGEYIGS